MLVHFYHHYPEDQVVQTHYLQMHIILTSDAPYEERRFTDQTLVNMFHYINLDNIDTKAMDMVLRTVPKISDDITLILVFL